MLIVFFRVDIVASLDSVVLVVGVARAPCVVNGDRVLLG